jgi:ATP-binding cassette subfamily C protein LapB
MEKLTEQPIFTWLQRKTPLSRDILLASAIANLLALAAPLYSIQVMNRYISIGVDATLITLTVGALLAVAGEYVIRTSRADLTARVAADFEQEHAERLLKVFTESQLQSLERVQPNQRRELLSGLGDIQQAYSAGNIGALYDAPFSGLFLLALFLISVPLGLTALVLCGLAWWMSVRAGNDARKVAAEVSQETAKFNSVTQFLLAAGDTIRAFRFQSGAQGLWQRTLDTGCATRQRQQIEQTNVQQRTATVSTLLTVVIYLIGAKLVVLGQLDTGSLIGASILASRGLAGISRLAQLAVAMERARQAMQRITLAEKLPRERDTGMEPALCTGHLVLHDLCFAFPGQTAPVFESLNVEIQPGAVVVISGPNGSGKTTLARMLLGLLDPDRGQVRIEDLEIRQLSMSWWRSKVMYVPQEPQFFEGSLRENLVLGSSDVSDEQLAVLMRKLGLDTFINGQKEGYDMPVRAAGQSLPLGIRRRLAFVRALIQDGPVAVFDEPLEAIDPEGCKTVAALLNEFTRAGKTLILCSNDAFVLNAATIVIDLGKKPVPEVRRMQGAAPTPATGALGS